MLFPVRFSIFRCVVRRRSVAHRSRINRRLFEQRLGVLLNLQRKVRACGPCARRAADSDKPEISVS